MLTCSVVVVSPFQVESYQDNELSIAQAMKVLRESFTEAKHEAQREVARFSDERLRLYTQVGTGWIVESSATIIAASFPGPTLILLGLGMGLPL